MVKRFLQDQIKSKLNDEKAIIVFGARQVGKTMLLHMLFDNNEDTLWLNGDEPDIRALFENATPPV